MAKYGLQFEPVPGREGWFAAVAVRDDEAVAAAERIHREFDVEAELVFCGLHPSDGRQRLYLIQAMDALEILRDFEVGAKAVTYDENVVAETERMLRSVYATAPFTPILVNPAAFHARFLSPIDERQAQKVLNAIEEHGCQGLDYYASNLPILSNQDIVSRIVDTQMLNLWWD